MKSLMAMLFIVGMPVAFAGPAGDSVELTYYWSNGGHGAHKRDFTCTIRGDVMTSIATSVMGKYLPQTAKTPWRKSDVGSIADALQLVESAAKGPVATSIGRAGGEVVEYTGKVIRAHKRDQRVVLKSEGGQASINKSPAAATLVKFLTYACKDQQS